MSQAMISTSGPNSLASDKSARDRGGTGESADIPETPPGRGPTSSARALLLIPGVFVAALREPVVVRLVIVPQHELANRRR